MVGNRFGRCETIHLTCIHGISYAKQQQQSPITSNYMAKKRSVSYILLMWSWMSLILSGFELTYGTVLECKKER